ncbi:hypothetical protein ACOMHN_052550 [Nucella lapillus]
MVDPSSAQFISSLVKSLQMFCHGYMDFEDNIEIIGHINLRIDNRHKLDYIVSEHVSKQGQESTCFQSNSYHSLPPRNGSDQQSSRENLHSVVDSPMAVLGGTRIQVDLSGPSPVTRSTFASYPDGFLNPQGSGQTYSQKRVSPAYDSEQTTDAKGSASATPQGHISHPHAFSKDTKGSASVMQGHSFSLPHTLSKDVRLSDSAGAESAMPVVVSSHSDGQQQNLLLSGHLQNVTIKAEPGTLSLAEKLGDSNSMGSEEMMETSLASVCTVQAPVVSASMAYSQPASRPSVSFTPPVTFDTSLLPLDHEPRGPVRVVQFFLWFSVLERREAGRTGRGSEDTRPLCLVDGGTDSSPPNPGSTAPHPGPLRGTLGAECVKLNSRLGASKSEQASSPSSCMYAGGKDGGLSGRVMSSSGNGSGWWCSLCGKAFGSGELLDMHRQFVHQKHTSAPSSRAASQTAGVMSAGQSSVASSVTDNDALSLEPPLLTPGFLNEVLDGDLFHGDKKMNFLGASISQVSRPHGSERTGPGAQNCWLQDAQAPPNAPPNRPVENQLSQSSRRQGAWAANSFCVNPSYTPSSHAVDFMNSSYCNTSYSAAPPRMSCPLPKPSSLSGRRVSNPGRRCKHCHKILHFVNHAQFVDHEQNCTKEGVCLPCVQCGRSFASKVALKDHVDSMHTKKGFQCRACGMVFKWRTYVYQHRYKCAAYRIKREPV